MGYRGIQGFIAIWHYSADESAWYMYVHLPTILDNRIAAETIAPVILELIDPKTDCFAWYLYNSDYLIDLERTVDYIGDQYSTS